MDSRRAGTQAVTAASGRAARRVRWGAACAAAVLAAACADRSSGIRIERAALVVPAGGSLAALYFTVQNGQAHSDTIHAVRVDGAESVAMHQPRQHVTGVVDPMAEAAMVPLPPHSTVRFAPGGQHVMVRLSGFTLRRGTAVRMVLYRSRGDSTVGAARVVEYSDLDSVLAPPTLWRRMVALAVEVRRSAGSRDTAEAAPNAIAGRDLYLASGCASCHGALGRGDGPVAKTLNPPPRDFRDAAAFKAGTSAGAIAQVIAAGIPGGGAMPAHPHLNERERQSLALYIISLRPGATPGSPSP